jgi:hypothetical protein
MGGHTVLTDGNISQQADSDIGAGVPKPARHGGTHMQKLVVSEVERWRKILVDLKEGE